MSTSFNVATVAILLLTLYGAVVTYLIAARSGYKIRLKNIKTPFADFETSGFTDISAVMVFNNVSRALINNDNELHFPRIIFQNPTLMIHFAWQLVCDAYIKEFLEYPSDSSLSSAAEKIGAQNVEFVTTYREISKAAAKHGKFSEEFAEAYASRAPNLARRIVQEPEYNPVIIWQEKIDEFQIKRQR